MYTYIYTYMCMAVYICIQIFKGHGFTEAKIPTIVASAVCCFCRVQRLLWRGFPLLRSHCMNHSCCLFRMQRATSLILCDTTYLIIYLPPLYRHPCGTERYSLSCLVLSLLGTHFLVFSVSLFNPCSYHPGAGYHPCYFAHVLSTFCYLFSLAAVKKCPLSSFDSN